MNIKVYYSGKRGCADTIASVMAKELGTNKEALMPAYPPENVPLMFIGCEGAKADPVTLEFLRTINPGRVRSAALFACSPKAQGDAVSQMRECLEGKGVTVLPNPPTFSGKGAFGGRRPDDEEIEKARKYARECLNIIRGQS